MTLPPFLPSARPAPNTRTRTPASSLIPVILAAVRKDLLPRLQPWRRATVVSQSPTFPNRILLDDGMSCPVLLAYTSSTVGAAGGPAIGDNLLIVHTTDNNPLILGKIVP